MHGTRIDVNSSSDAGLQPRIGGTRSKIRLAKMNSLIALGAFPTTELRRFVQVLAARSSKQS